MWYIRGTLKLAPVTERLKRKYRHVMKRDESHETRGLMTMNVDGYVGIVRTMKT